MKRFDFNFLSELLRFTLDSKLFPKINSVTIQPCFRKELITPKIWDFGPPISAFTVVDTLGAPER
jgi:hypothetical protein